jgi:hypothetical protein
MIDLIAGIVYIHRQVLYMFLFRTPTLYDRVFGLVAFVSMNTKHVLKNFTIVIRGGV